MKLLLAESDDFSEQVISFLDQKFDLTILNNLSQIEFESTFLEYDIIWFRLNFNLLSIDNKKDIRCKYIVCPVTGTNHISNDFLEKNGINLISLKGESTFLKEITPTAEHTVFLTLALIRNAFKAIDDVKNGNWNRDEHRGNELKGKTVGIIGYGRLGEMTAKIFSAFNCKIRVYDPYSSNKVNQDYFVSQDIQDVFKLCDIISVHVDLNSGTNGFIDENLLKYCENTFLINTSRGEVLNEADIIKALDEGRLKGFAADVIENESINYQKSLLFKNNLKSKNNIILTPHIGGNTYESFNKTEDFVYKKLINQIKSNGE